MASETYTQIIEKAYNGFNRRDIPSVLKLMTVDVHWPNGWEGGYVQGHDEVREYWTRQWKEIDPTVTPVFISELPDDVFDVEVRQVLKDKSGAILSDSLVHHIYTFENSKIKKMEIVKLEGLKSQRS